MGAQLLAVALGALLLAGCDPDYAYPARTPSTTGTTGPSGTPFTTDLSVITGVEVFPSITKPDQAFTVVITYIPGKTSSNIPCFIMENAAEIAKWKSPTEDAYPDDPSRFKTVEEPFAEGMADIGHFLIECESPGDGGSPSAYLDVTPDGLPPTSIEPDQSTTTGTSAPRTPAPATPSLGTATPSTASSGPFAGLSGGDLIFDLAAATSSNGGYPRPVDSCWPQGYNTTDTSGIAISALGKVTGICGAKDSNGTTYQGQVIAGYYVPEVNHLSFTLETLMEIPNVGATGFGLYTKYWITFDVKGSFTSASKAAGTATWKLDCVAGDTLKCSSDPAQAAEMTADGTVPWTLTFDSTP
jgi:hypothetical protein